MSDDIHDLLNPVFQDRIIVPREWTGWWVGHRIVEAHRVLMRVRVSRGPMQFGSCMPSYTYDFADLVGQAGQSAINADIEEDGSALAETYDEWNDRPIMPTAHEIALMEDALVWPSQYLRHIKGAVGCVGAWARCRARDVDLQDWIWARRLPFSAETVERMAMAGLEFIARAMRKAKVEVR